MNLNSIGDLECKIERVEYWFEMNINGDKSQRYY